MLYLAGEFSSIRQLILLDGGFIKLSDVLSLEQEEKELAEYLATTSFSSSEEAVLREKEQSPYWSKSVEQAVSESFCWNVNANRWELDLEKEGLLSLIRLRREVEDLIQSPPCPVALIAADLYGDSPSFREERLASLPSGVQLIQMKNIGHSLYLEKPLELAALVRDLLATDMM